MNDEPKLSKNFNVKLFSDLRRKIYNRNLFNIIITGFLKGFILTIDFLFSWMLKKDDKNEK